VLFRELEQSNDFSLIRLTAKVRLGLSPVDGDIHPLFQ
jgi:hypothetical protein